MLAMSTIKAWEATMVHEAAGHSCQQSMKRMPGPAVALTLLLE